MMEVETKLQIAGVLSQHPSGRRQSLPLPRESPTG
jgi:hypothetical protein